MGDGGRARQAAARPRPGGQRQGPDAAAGAHHRAARRAVRAELPDHRPPRQTVTRLRRRAHEAHARDRRAAGHDGLPARPPDPARRRQLVGPGEARRRRRVPRVRRLLGRRDRAHARRRPGGGRRRSARRRFPKPAKSVEVDGLTVTKSDDLGFTVTRDGKPVAIQDYLGAKGHLVALREGDLAFLHVHPDERRLQFEATFPTAGRYRLFLQFKTTDGRLHTAAFTQEVTR